MPHRLHGIDARIQNRLASNVGQRRYELWIEPSVRIEYRDELHTLHVAVPNRFVAEKIRSDFSDELRSAARAEAELNEQAELRLDLCIEPDRFAKPAGQRPAESSDA